MSVVNKIKLPNNTTVDINDARVTGIDSTPTASSTNLISSGGMYTTLTSYPKYVLCADEAAYNAIQNKDSGTLYLIPES